MQPHEYSVVGHNRAVVGRWLFTVASILVAGATAVGVVLASVAGWLGLPASWQAWLLAPISAAATFTVVHFAFSKLFWKGLCRFRLFPNVSGSWKCEGKTMNGGDVLYEWEGEATIDQDWEKIRVFLRTRKSKSHSVAASLLPENDGRWLLMYSYRNEADVGHPELRDHYGYCEMRFAKDGRSADGNYFTAPGRGTAGRMHLTRNS